VLLFCWVLVFVVWATTLPPTTYSVANNTNEPRAAVSRLVQLFIFTAYSFRIAKGAVRDTTHVGWGGTNRRGTNSKQKDLLKLCCDVAFLLRLAKVAGLAPDGYKEVRNK
jgi:hypothetical protein